MRLQGWKEKALCIKVQLMTCESLLCVPHYHYILLFRFLSALSLCPFGSLETSVWTTPSSHGVCYLMFFVFTGLLGRIRTFNFNWEAQYVKAN